MQMVAPPAWPRGPWASRAGPPPGPSTRRRAPAADLERLLEGALLDGRCQRIHVLRLERRQRRLILWLFGGIGALFGIAGAAMLSKSIGILFTDLLSMESLMQLPLFAVAAAAFYIWVMNDDLAIGR